MKNKTFCTNFKNLLNSFSLNFFSLADLYVVLPIFLRMIFLVFPLNFYKMIILVRM